MATVATAQQIQSIQRDDKGLVGGAMPGDPLAAMLQSQTAESGPELELAPATLDLVPTGTWRFRTRRGRRNTSIKLRVYRETGDEHKDMVGRKKFEQWAKTNFGGGNPKKGIPADLRKALKALKVDEELVDIIGDYYIHFKPVDGHMEAVYETDNPKVAAYIRSLLPIRPEIYEEVAPVMVTMPDGTQVQMIPATHEARLQMAAAAAGG